MFVSAKILSQGLTYVPHILQLIGQRTYNTASKTKDVDAPVILNLFNFYDTVRSHT